MPESVRRDPTSRVAGFIALLAGLFSLAPLLASRSGSAPECFPCRLRLRPTSTFRGLGEPPPISLIPQARPLGYAFDPIPSAIRGDSRLKPVDHLVLAILLSFSVWRRDSCWTTIATIAARLPALRPHQSGSNSASQRTVQRSLERLKAAGYLRHEQVARPDLDDPRNRTGWRFYFNFVPLNPLVQSHQEKPTQSTHPSPIIPLSSSREMTPQSPDSLVTQERGEVFKESESTLNVAALARSEDREKTTEVEPPVPEPARPVATDPPRASAAWTPREQAEKFFRRLRDRGLILKIALDPERGEVIQTYGLTNSVEPIQEEEIAELRQLRPRSAAFLKGSRSQARHRLRFRESSAGPTSSGFRSGRGAVAAEAVMSGNRDDAIETRVSRALGEALNDRKLESQALFLGLAGEVRRGVLAEGCLQEAFEAACGRQVENRGAMLTVMVRRWMGRSRGARVG